MTLGFIFFLVTLIAELAFYLMGTGLELAGGPSLEYLTWHIFLPSGINLVLFLIVMILFWCWGFAPSIYYLQIPFYVLMSFLFFTLWAQFASLMAAISQDFANLVKSFITPIFWLSGILWRTDNFTGSVWIRRFLNLNPVTFLTSGFRDALIFNKWFWETPKKCLYFACWLVVLWVLSLWAYKRLRKDIPDVL